MLRLCTFLTLMLSSIPIPAKAGGGGKIAILDIQTTGVDPSYVNILTEILSTEVEALAIYDSVIAGRDIATMMGFERQRELVGCDHEECLVELGGALGVDRIIAGHVAKIGKVYIVQIKMINVLEHRPEKRIYETVKGTEDVLIATIRDCVKKLVPAATSGAHEAKTAAGVNRTSVATSKSSSSMTPWLFMGAGVAAIGGGVYFGLEASKHQKDTDPNIPGSQKAIQDTKSAALIANIAYGVGIASGVVGILFRMREGSDSPLLPHAEVIPLPDGIAVS